MDDSRRDRRRLVAETARLGQLGWFVGNLYEGVVGVPQLVASASDRSPGVLTAGSPARFFLLLVPPTLVASTLDLVQRWTRSPAAGRAGLAVEASGLASAVVVSAYLIRKVNVPLLTEPVTSPVGHPDRRLRRWHTLNAVRVACLGVALVARGRAGQLWEPPW